MFNDIAVFDEFRIFWWVHDKANWVEGKIEPILANIYQKIG